MMSRSMQIFWRNSILIPCLSVLSLLEVPTLSANLFGWGNFTKKPSKPQEVAQEPSSPSTDSFYPVPQRLTARGTSERGIGYPDSYATLEGLFAPYSALKFNPMLDVRGHFLFNNEWAANAGLIGRWFTDCTVWGANVYYDYRQGELNHYNQIGAGLEVLQKRWELRINGYFPLKGKHQLRCSYNDAIGPLGTLIENEYSFRGFNAELAALFGNQDSLFFTLAAGPYYLKSSAQQAWGAKARFRPQFKDFVALEFSTSYDHIFHNIYQGEIILNIPLYRIFNKTKKSTCLRRLYQLVERFEIIPLKTRSHWQI